MQLYRISNCRRIRDLSGSGGLYASGRWHHKGTRILYFSEHISLAKLEVLVNVSLLPKAICLLVITVPDSVKVEQIHINDLPDDWGAYPYTETPRRLTAKWLSAGKSLVLKVPSAQSPQEYNYLLNPLHADISKISIDSVEEIEFDPRLRL